MLPHRETDKQTAKQANKQTGITKKNPSNFVGGGNENAKEGKEK